MKKNNCKRNWFKTIFFNTTLVVSLLWGCSGNNVKNKSNGLFIDVTRNDKISIKDFFSKIELVPLETSKSSMISNPDKIVFNKERFYVLDSRLSAIFVFDLNGKYIFKIQKSGRGPGEYIDIHDFEINPYTGDIEALSARGQLLRYDPEGKYLNSFWIEPSISAVHYFKHLTDDKIIFYSGTETSKLYFYSKKQHKIIKQTHEIPEFVSRKTHLNHLNSPFFVYNSKVYYYEASSNDVYVIENDNINLVYSWDFGKYNLNIKDLPNDRSREYYLNALKTENGKYACNFLYNIENDKNIFTTFTYNGKWTNLIFDKRSNTYKVFSEFSEGVTFFTLDFFNEGIFSYINPMHLNLLATPGILDSGNSKKLDKIKIEDNTVIVKYYFKNKNE